MSVPNRASVAPLDRRSAMPQAARILVLDRSRLLADVLARRLLAEDDVAAVAVASSGAEALRLLTEDAYHAMVATPDLILEIDAAPVGRAASGRLVPVIVLADTADSARVRELFHVRGVAGWVNRDRSSEELMATLRTCLRGDACVPIDIMHLLAEDHIVTGGGQSARDRVLSLLTQREVEVLLLLEQGMGREEIAAALHLSPNTVRTHVQRILRRLDVHSTLGALALLRA